MQGQLFDTPVSEVRISSIIITRRLREVDAEKVDEIADSVEREGLLYPIVLWKSSRGLILVAGRHRLEAFRSLGMKSIPARVIKCKSEDQARLIEIDDNLCRSDLGVLEKAIQFRIREDLLIKSGERAKRGRDGGGQGKVTSVQLAGSAQMCLRRWQEHMQIARGIPPDLCNAILGTPLANHMTGLIELSRVKDKRAQKAAAMRAIKMDDVSTLKVAKVIKEEVGNGSYKPINGRANNRRAERMLILRVARIVKEAEEKMRSVRPKASKSLAVARDMIEKISAIISLGGIRIQTEEPFSSHFLKDRNYTPGKAARRQPEDHWRLRGVRGASWRGRL